VKGVATACIWLGVAGVLACAGALGWRAVGVRRAHAAADAAWEKHRSRAEMVSIGGTEDVAPFSIDRTEVTVAAYRACVAAGACSSPSPGELCNGSVPDRELHPVNCVDHDQATAFCAWTGQRLPTQKEWELAACGANARKFPWPGDKLEQQDCFGRHAGTCAVGTHPGGATPEGVLGLGGNVSEWTSSELVEADMRSNRFVQMGASWIWPTRSVEPFECSSEQAHARGYRDSLIGFRCAKSAERSLLSEVIAP
jgi:formylglycine-generating enzyme required for sulfatase activity